MQKCQLPNAENFPGRLETMEPVAETMKKHKKKYTPENEWMSPKKGLLRGAICWRWRLTHKISRNKLAYIQKMGSEYKQAIGSPEFYFEFT